MDQFQGRILVVDDLVVGREIIQDMLELMGCEVDTAFSVEQVLELYQQHEYDLIFMDIHIPEMNGFEITKKLRSIPKEGKKPVIYGISADVFCEKDVSTCVESGMDGCISKPVKAAKFQELLKTHCVSVTSI